jgi:hypothetical protein
MPGLASIAYFLIPGLHGPRDIPIRVTYMYCTITVCPLVPNFHYGIVDSGDYGTDRIVTLNMNTVLIKLKNEW